MDKVQILLYLYSREELQKEYIMPLSGKKLKKLAKKAGWIEDHVTGSHHIMKKEGFPAVSIPVHGNKDLNKH